MSGFRYATARIREIQERFEAINSSAESDQATSGGKRSRSEGRSSPAQTRPTFFSIRVLLRRQGDATQRRAFPAAPKVGRNLSANLAGAKVGKRY
ncbi:hypothetical protein MRX96_033608 [Rhipicephalus microplus]